MALWWIEWWTMEPVAKCSDAAGGTVATLAASRAAGTEKPEIQGPTDVWWFNGGNRPTMRPGSLLGQHRPPHVLASGFWSPARMCGPCAECEWSDRAGQLQEAR
jgi:hypothetical protein